MDVYVVNINFGVLSANVTSNEGFLVLEITFTRPANVVSPFIVESTRQRVQKTFIFG